MRNQGFTLIEMAIVLTIIGLVIGAVLTGSSLIEASRERATISQIERYQSAVHTFDERYGGLPGDINTKIATQFGFSARGTNSGQGDGNGLIEGAGFGAQTYSPIGEPLMFWVDLTYANGLNVNLIDGNFNTATSTMPATNVSVLGLNSYLPTAKIGQGNYIYVYSGGWMHPLLNVSDGNNYFGLSAVVDFTDDPLLDSNSGLTVKQAYDIDSKIDDGLPQSGNVLALYNEEGATWAASGSTNGAFQPGTYGPTTNATVYNAKNCYDNSGVVGPQTYSLAKNANLMNCALSFRFQNSQN